MAVHPTLQDNLLAILRYCTEAATTMTGLKAAVNIIDKCSETRRQYATDVKEKVTIRLNGFLSKQNYTFVSKTG